VSTFTKRLVGLILAVVVVGVAIGVYVSVYLTRSPQAFAAGTGVSGTQLTLASVPAVGSSDTNPDWVSFFALSPNPNGRWIHTTTYRVPAHSLIHVTIYNYDGASGLRNPFYAQAQGTTGGTFLLNGKPTRTINPDDASHLFAIPALDVSVPLLGVPDDAKNPCAAAPCNLSEDHETISFTFRTGAPGRFRWQCFVPCAAGWIFGTGGPMQTIGYMDGFVEVV
jgi:hypothetical protein